jgi:hypothetical protein
MEKAIRENQFVLIICTPGYKQRADERKGGVGYEGDVITGEVVTMQNHRKFIPVLRSGEWVNAAPTWVAGKYFIDLRGSPYSSIHYADLVATLYGEKPQAPPLGSKPERASAPPTPVAVSSTESAPVARASHEPLKITGIIADKVTVPRMDGSRGSALYEIPFRLSRRPPPDWEDLFVESWNHPAQFTSMHRSGIASVEGDVIWLRGTTLDEVEHYHRDTLKLAIATANNLYEEIQRKHQSRHLAEKERTTAHTQSINDAAKRISFD